VVRTMTAIVLALAASLAWGCSDFLGGLQTRRQHLLGVLLVSQAAGLAIVMLGSLYPLTTVALAWLLLRERASLPQGVGEAGALAGVALVSLGA
jgi:uncharacterized membrane protein